MVTVYRRVLRTARSRQSHDTPIRSRALRQANTTILTIKVLFSALLLATTVIAEGASIVAAIELIEADTIAISNTVTAWSDDLTGVVPS